MESQSDIFVVINTVLLLLRLLRHFFQLTVIIPVGLSSCLQCLECLSINSLTLLDLW